MARCDGIKMWNSCFDSYLLRSGIVELSYAVNFRGCMETDEEEFLAGHFLMQFNAAVRN